MDSREFRASQTLEAVDFVKSHPFINEKWTMCSGPRYAFLTNYFVKTKIISIILFPVIYLQYRISSLKITETECRFIAVSSVNC